MAETDTVTLADLSHEVRSKNAGPFWVTIELFLRDEDAYRIAADETFLDEHTVARLYGVLPDEIQIFRVPSLNVVKVSFPRPVTQASLRDRDIHSGQQHVPLATLPVPSV